MNVWLPDGTNVRCQQWDEVETIKEQNPDWTHVTGWMGETIETNTDRWPGMEAD